MNAISAPDVRLNNGEAIPQLGLGVFKVEPGVAERVTSDALEVGYRHIDTASFYENEEEVGRAIAASDVPRDELFITTKLWNTDQTRVHEAFEESLERLGLDFVDLFLIHWPQPMFGEALGAWRSLIELAGSGRAKSIGVSNFEIEHLQQLLDETGVVPTVNQIELHPLHQRRDLVRFCRDHGIAIEAWGPLAQGKSDLFDRPEVLAAAEEHGKSPAQIIIRWHLQQDRILFPKTTRRARMIENADVFDFDLGEATMEALDGFDIGKNFGSDPRTMDYR